MTEKMRSRTFWVAIIWMAFIPLAIIAQLIIGDKLKIPISEIVSFGGGVSLAWMGKRGIQEFKKPQEAEE